MFRVDVPERPYADPWLQPLGERLAMLGRGRRRAAYYYEAANNSTFRYRAYNMAQVLNHDQTGDTSAAWFFRTDLDRIDEIADAADVLVVCRSGYEHAVAQLIARFHARGKPVLFDIDDFVFDTDYVHLIIDTLGLDKSNRPLWDEWFGMVSRMGRTLRCCDGAITTNEFLAGRMRAWSGRPVAVVPNFMNREQIAISDAVYGEKRRRGFERDGTVTLGYFSGTPSHRLDFAIVEGALEALLEARPELQLMTVGFIEPGPALARFGGRIRREPFRDWVNLQRLVSTVEVNLMPLQANVFTDCKSALKYFEAAAVGTLSVASPGHNYAAAITDGRTGRLSRAHEWSRVLEQAIAGLEGYAEMAARARDDALQRFSWTTQRGAILRALNWQ